MCRLADPCTSTVRLLYYGSSKSEYSPSDDSSTDCEDYEEESDDERDYISASDVTQDTTLDSDETLAQYIVRRWNRNGSSTRYFSWLKKMYRGSLISQGSLVLTSSLIMHRQS